MSRSNLSPIEKAVQKNLRHYFPDVGDPFFVLGVSGGMDSMSLLYAFKRLGMPALVSHINYQKRGEASDQDAELVEKLASEWGFECHISKVDPSGAEDQNFQQWARNLRYDIFQNLADEYGADGIAVAHHEDDQVETILQKIFRGAGLASWSGMSVRDGQLFRPLLEVSREQIEAYVTEHTIPYRTDESNLKDDFARNFLRNEWLTQLSQFFPAWKKNVMRTSEQAEHYERALEWISGAVCTEHGIKRKAFHSLDPGLQKALVLHLIKQQKPGIQVSSDSLERLEELAGLQTGKGVQLTRECLVLRDRSFYVIRVGGEDFFHAQTVSRKQLRNAVVIEENISLQIQKFQDQEFGKGLCMDADKIQWPITIRRWQDGDSFQPLGMEGHQQVSDHLTNRKISSAHKNEALVVESFEDTICAIIFPPIKNQTPPGTISEKVKCDSDTEECLEIKHRN